MKSTKESTVVFVLFLLSGAFLILNAADGPVNIAPLGTATQSSDYNATFTADLAVDGDLTNFTHTNASDLQPRWELTFDEETEFSMIVMHNRDSCCQLRLKDIIVSVLDEPDGDVVYESELLNPENERNNPESIELDIVAEEGSTVSGRVIRIARIPDQNLTGDDASVISLGEVLVYGAFEGIIRQPAGGRVSYGQPFEFSVSASVASGELSYQWKKDGVDIEGATESTYAIDFVELDDAGDYSVVVEGNGQTFESEIAPLEVPGLNAAPFGTASQSSTLGAYTAARATDGSFDNFTHTQAGQADPWWEIDLLKGMEIEKIVIYNRTSCCGSRLRDITVAVLDEVDGDVVYESDLLNPENELGVFPLGPDMLELDIAGETGEAAAGRVVRVSRLSDPDLSGTGGEGNNAEMDVLSIGEIEIFVTIGECPEEGDTHVEDLVVEGPGGNQPGNYTITAAAEDDSGDESLLYTFTVSNVMSAAPPVIIGPQTEEFINVMLDIGTWRVTATVDDDPVCPDAADDAGITRDISVEGDPENLAWQGVTSQSTTCYNDPAYYAVDGNAETFSHTCGPDENASWEVDFGTLCRIDFIELQNRPGYGSRLRDITIYILDGEGNEVFTSGLLNPENELVDPPSLSIDLAEETGDAVTGQMVRIVRTPDPDGSGSSGQGNPVDDANVLTLVEVMILGEEGGTIEGVKAFTGDTNCDGGVNIADAVSVLSYLFAGGDACCLINMDTNDDGSVNIADAVTLLAYQFAGGDITAPDGAVISDPACNQYGEGDIPEALSGCTKVCPYNR